MYLIFVIFTAVQLNMVVLLIKVAYIYCSYRYFNDYIYVYNYVDIQGLQATVQATIPSTVLNKHQYLQQRYLTSRNVRL